MEEEMVLDQEVSETQEVSEESEVLVNDSPEKEPFGQRFLAGLKERWRKFLVSTKRKPQRLSFLPLVVASIVWMFGETYFAQTTIYDNISGMGLCVFINTLMSILTLLLFMYTFPKRAKHPNYIFMALTFVAMAAMIACDLIWYISSYDIQFEAFTNNPAKAAGGMAAFSFAIAHLVLVGLSALLLATLPLYKPLILSIDTSKKLEENTLGEEIDTSAEV